MKVITIIFNIIINIIVIENSNEKELFIQFDSMAFQERNGTCGMKPEHSGQNLAKKSRTDRDLKLDENCSVFWIGM